MKRHKNIYKDFVSDENILKAILSAVKGKKHRQDVKSFMGDIKNKVNELKGILAQGWIPSPYRNKIIRDKGKERLLSIAPFFPDRIIHHMVNNSLEKIYMPIFISDTYQCIKGRGTHKAINKTKQYMKVEENAWVLKLDIKKYYPNVDNEILKQKLRRKIKDLQFLSVVDSIIDSHKGLPLGNHTSQLLGNIYLNDIDHLIKSKCKYYVRYADDLVIMGDKSTVSDTYDIIKNSLNVHKLELNMSTQKFCLKDRHLSFLGFVYDKYGRNGVYIRPKKQKLIQREYSSEQKASLFGWVKGAKSVVFLHKLFRFELYIQKKPNYVYRFLIDKNKRGIK